MVFAALFFLDMPYKEQNLEGCDATDGDSSSKAGNINPSLNDIAYRQAGNSAI